ncbi:DNA-binding MarR family transcriptional regulator [Solirubrobacter pauli]|uniref:DNA-binding MarR family transcriptional regulator n=1 Tax=Solirubrobacter pauli TaxID=166793 RepID=A0A660L0M9_9ACTN|nr:MarR family transcriptional regulator [Solirubrobacter pauli]RKQ86895.1 DNA-binding MarR family transcriptional regulator [Solirubrobacter pauli]
MRTISTTDLAHRLRPVLTRLARRMRQEATGDLTPTQIAALVTVVRFGPLTPSELASRERIQRPTATRVLGLFEERGLIERTADPSDRRSSLVSATDRAEALLAEVRDKKDAYLAQRLDTLTPADLATLEAAAEILERVLDE